MGSRARVEEREEGSETDKGEEALMSIEDEAKRSTGTEPQVNLIDRHRTDLFRCESAETVLVAVQVVTVHSRNAPCDANA
jgi:hypothetical protein